MLTRTQTLPASTASCSRYTEDYDDSGLRESAESAPATADAGLQRLIEDNTSLINDTNDALGAERATRADQVAKLHADVQQEADARERGDSDLQAQIDDLEVPEDFEETIERIDNDIKVTNEKVDFNAEETLKDQERQDKELEDYKLEVTADQERQDKELEDYKAEVTADQERQDKELEDYAEVTADQERQADALAETDAAAADADLQTQIDASIFLAVAALPG